MQITAFCVENARFGYFDEYPCFLHNFDAETNALMIMDSKKAQAVDFSHAYTYNVCV